MSLVGFRLAGGLQRVSENNKSAKRKGPPQEEVSGTDSKQNSYVALVHGLFFFAATEKASKKREVVCIDWTQEEKRKLIAK